MTQFMFRLAALLLLAITGLLLSTLLAAHQWMSIPSITIQHALAGTNTTYTAYDMTTGVHFDYSNTMNGTVSPDEKLTFDTAWIDDKFHIYLSDYPDGQSELLGIYEQFSGQSSMIWANDSASIFATTKHFREELELYQIDIQTGDATLIGAYEFGAAPNFIHMLTDHLLMMEREAYFALIDTTTGEMTSYESPFTRRISRDRRYLVYGNVEAGVLRSSDISELSTVLHILDLETLEQVSITEEQLGEHIYDVSSWSPTHQLLPIMLDDGRIIIYDAETQTFESLPDQYHEHASFFTAWSNDGTRLIVRNILTKELLILNHKTGEEVPLLKYNELVIARSSSAYVAQWSPDDRYIVITPDFIADDIAYQFYDATTGELVRELNELPFEIGGNHFVSWY